MLNALDGFQTSGLRESVGPALPIIPVGSADGAYDIVRSGRVSATAVVVPPMRHSRPSRPHS